MTELTIKQIEEKARDHLAPFGFHVFGWFSEESGKPALLIGNVGSGIWGPFQNSAEFHDGLANPLDRWTEARLEPLAEILNAEARYPFGAKVWPFQEYAKRTTGMKQSPIGLLIHPKFGLWSAFRAVLVFDVDFDLPQVPPLVHPCYTCVAKPCLTSCPIEAFTPEGYDYVSCKTHVRSGEGKVCKLSGCIARNACPIGKNHVNLPGHQAFHMSAFV